MSSSVRPRPTPTAAIDPLRLAVLVDEVVRADQDAFAELFELVAPVVTARLHTWPAGSVDPASVRAIIAGTFVEVWWLAPSHNGPDTDVLRWISGIAARRALD